MTDTVDKYENIAVLTPAKERFVKQYKAAKKGRRNFYMTEYVMYLLDLQEQAERKG